MSSTPVAETACILAGGFGTRLRSVVPDLPKGLAPIAGRPFLHWQLDWLARGGISRVVLCTGHGAEAMEKALGKRYQGMELVYSQEHSPLGTAGALRHALPHIEAEAALVCNGDSYICTELKDFIEWKNRLTPPAALMLTQVPDTSRYGRVQVDGVGRVLRFEEKQSGMGPGCINAGVYFFDRETIEAIPEGPCSMEQDVLPQLARQETLFGFTAQGDFIDIGTPESYARAAVFFKGLA